MIILTADTHVSTERYSWEATMGKFVHGEINDKGYTYCHFLPFSATNTLVIRSTHFQHLLKHRLKWRNLAGKNAAVLDYVLINTRFRSSLLEVCAMQGHNSTCIHYLVLAWLCCKVRLDWRHLNDITHWQDFQLTLAKLFISLAPLDSVEAEEKHISDAILECAKPLCLPARRQTQTWILAECLNFVDQCRKAKLVNLNGTDS